MMKAYTLVLLLMIGMIIIDATIAELDGTVHQFPPPAWKRRVKECIKRCKEAYSKFPESLKKCKRGCIKMYGENRT
ncbi:uncharacterized protein DS421_2g56000 [Arachis hypogaea]|nr:uncharacterized protein DS421_2g56000 [Arachis hypogaea]